MAPEGVVASGTLVYQYQPVIKMAERAAQLRQELEALSSQSAASTSPHPPNADHKQQKKPQLRLSVRTSDSGSSPPPAQTPAVTRHRSAALQWPAAHAAASKGIMAGSSRSSLAGSTADSAHAPYYCSSSMGDASPTARSPSSSVKYRHSASRPGSPLRGTASDAQLHVGLQQKMALMEEQLADLKHRNSDLNQDLEQRQQSYMRREEQMSTRIRQLEEQLARANAEHADNPVFGKASMSIKELHSQVTSEIEALLTKQAVALKYEEATTLRRFKERLNEMEAQVNAERSANAKVHSDWLEKTASLRTELEHTQEIAGRLDKMYKLSEEECQRLRAQFKCQEDDRQYLVRQIVALKKDRERLVVELAAVTGDLQQVSAERDDLLSQVAPGSPSLTTTAAAGSGAPVAGSKESIQAKRYEDVIDNLRKMLEAEKKRTKQARAVHMAELQQRTELQTILRQCVEDVRERKRQQQQQGWPSSDSGIAAAAANYSTGTGQFAGTLNSIHFTTANAATSTSTFGTSTSTGSRRPMSAHIAGTAGRAALRRFSSTGASSSSSGGGGDSSSLRRPASAVPSSCRRPSSAVQSLRAADAGLGAALDAPAREELVKDLLAQENLLKLLFDRCFGPPNPFVPGDGALQQLVAAHEQQEQQVVSSGKALTALTAMKQSGMTTVPAKFIKGAPSGGLSMKEAAEKPWVLNVDAMMASFLSSGSRPAAQQQPQQQSRRPSENKES